MEFENSVVIDRPRSEVFSYLVDLESLPAWNYAIARTTKITPGETRVGSVYVQQRTLPRPMTEELRVTAYEPESLLAVSGGFADFTGISTYELVSLDSGQTMVRNRVQLEANGIPRFLAATLGASRIKAAVGNNLNVLKGLLEAR